MEQQLYPASEIDQQAPCLQQQQQSHTSWGPRSDNNSKFEQCDAVRKDKATFVILVVFVNMPSALQMLYVFIGYMLWLPNVLCWNLCSHVAHRQDKKVHLAACTMQTTALAQQKQWSAHIL